MTRNVREKDQSGQPLVITYHRTDADRQAAVALRREQQERADEIADSLFHSTELATGDPAEVGTTG